MVWKQRCKRKRAERRYFSFRFVSFSFFVLNFENDVLFVFQILLIGVENPSIIVLSSFFRSQILEFMWLWRQFEKVKRERNEKTLAKTTNEKSTKPIWGKISRNRQNINEISLIFWRFLENYVLSIRCSFGYLESSSFRFVQDYASLISFPSLFTSCSKISASWCVGCSKVCSTNLTQKFV